MKFVIPKDKSFKYENSEAFLDILKITHKFNWEPDEERQLMSIIGKVRRSGYINCFNLIARELKIKNLVDDIEILTKEYHESKI